MTVTLSCAFCGRQESHPSGIGFKGWWAVAPLAGALPKEVQVCGLECLAGWAMRRELEREKEAKRGNS